MKKIPLLLILFMSIALVRAQEVKLGAYYLDFGHLSKNGTFKNNKHRYSGRVDYKYIINLDEGRIEEYSEEDDFINSYEITGLGEQKEDGSKTYWIKDADDDKWLFTLGSDLSYVAFFKPKSFLSKSQYWLMAVSDYSYYPTLAKK